MTATKKVDTLSLLFHKEQDTKNKIRYEEMDESGESPVPKSSYQASVGKIYITKKQCKEMGDPSVLRVTIKVV